jgi:hypothetical protein
MHEFAAKSEEKKLQYVPHIVIDGKHDGKTQDSAQVDQPV